MRPAIPRSSVLYQAKSMSVKYIDDGSVAAAVNLKSNLINDPAHHPRPLTRSQRTGHCLPSERNLLQKYICDAEDFADKNKMIINKKKTTAMKFTNSKKYDFPLGLNFTDGTEVESTEVAKMLGVIVSSNLKWRNNTNYICSKARRKLWLLRRLQPLGLSVQELFDVYSKEIRSILEFAVPVWHSGISKKEASEIEAIQKLAFRIILGQTYSGYSSACALLSSEPRKQRRQIFFIKQ